MSKTNDAVEKNLTELSDDLLNEVAGGVPVIVTGSQVTTMDSNLIAGANVLGENSAHLTNTPAGTAIGNGIAEALNTVKNK